MKTLVFLVLLAIIAFYVYKILKERALTDRARRENALHLVPETEVPKGELEAGGTQPSSAFDPFAEDAGDEKKPSNG